MLVGSCTLRVLKKQKLFFDKNLLGKGMVNITVHDESSIREKMLSENLSRHKGARTRILFFFVLGIATTLLAIFVPAFPKIIATPALLALAMIPLFFRTIRGKRQARSLLENGESIGGIVLSKEQVEVQGTIYYTLNIYYEWDKQPYQTSLTTEDALIVQPKDKVGLVISPNYPNNAVLLGPIAEDTPLDLEYEDKLFSPEGPPIPQKKQPFVPPVLALIFIASFLFMEAMLIDVSLNASQKAKNEKTSWLKKLEPLKRDGGYALQVLSRSESYGFVITEGFNGERIVQKFKHHGNKKKGIQLSKALVQKTSQALKAEIAKQGKSNIKILSLPPTKSCVKVTMNIHYPKKPWDLYKNESCINKVLDKLKVGGIIMLDFFFKKPDANGWLTPMVGLYVLLPRDSISLDTDILQKRYAFKDLKFHPKKTKPLKEWAKRFVQFVQDFREAPQSKVENWLLLDGIHYSLRRDRRFLYSGMKWVGIIMFLMFLGCLAFAKFLGS